MSVTVTQVELRQEFVHLDREDTQVVCDVKKQRHLWPDDCILFTVEAAHHTLGTQGECPHLERHEAANHIPGGEFVGEGS